MAGEIIWGVKAVREALETAARINRIYFAKESRADACDSLVDAARAAGAPFDFVPQAKLNAMTGVRDHQGVAAALSPAPYLTVRSFLETCPATATVLVVDQVQHPKNLGLLLRTAAGAGAAGVMLAARGGALVDGAVVHASAGAALRVPLVNCKNLAQGIRALRDAGFWTYALDAGAAETVFDVAWPRRCALVVGNETAGVRPVVRKACDGAVAIPLAGGLDSLNAAVAAGVALFQVVAWRRRADQSIQRASGGVA
ncbi:MAG TPA: 23S rRNA (guanosine(2251)-2'-O)-methyltransferase RlmB [Candidatus Hydrogenedentes bacterium]|nr:23S rRNA (guanosine(2251)-2'-O)-methyltransferase RlmB [Candidatus Hydrogenedentota bacterium]